MGKGLVLEGVLFSHPARSDPSDSTCLPPASRSSLPNRATRTSLQDRALAAEHVVQSAASEGDSTEEPASSISSTSGWACSTTTASRSSR